MLEGAVLWLGLPCERQQGVSKEEGVVEARTQSQAGRLPQAFS